MNSATVRISLPVRDQLRDLAHQVGKPMQTVVEEAVELYRRHCFLKDFNAAYAALREDDDAWAEVNAEREAWDAAVGDGLLVEDRE